MSILAIIMLLMIVAIFWLIRYILDCFDEGYNVIWVWMMLLKMFVNPGNHSEERKVANELLEDYENRWMEKHYLGEEA